MPRMPAMLLLLAPLAALHCTTVNTGGTACEGRIVDGVCTGLGADAVGSDAASYQGLPCTTNLQCGDLACIGGFCSVECKLDKDCPGDQVCRKLVCATDAGPEPDATVAPDADPAFDAGPSDAVALPDGALPDATAPVKCTNHLDCAPDGACIGGWCAKECDEDWECGAEAGWECIEFQCFFTDPNQPDVTTPPEDTGTPAPDTVTPAKAGYGEPCTVPSGCESNLCLGAAGEGTCTKECVSPSQCLGSDTCLDVGGKKLCYPSDSGEPCSQGCVAGFSLSNPKQACVCAVECETNLDCQSGAACSDWGKPGGGVVRLCTPIGQPCKVTGTAQGDVCMQVCYPKDQVNGTCTARCVTAGDCPAGWICKGEQLPDGTLLQTCQK